MSSSIYYHDHIIDILCHWERHHVGEIQPKKSTLDDQWEQSGWPVAQALSHLLTWTTVVINHNRLTHGHNFKINGWYCTYADETLWLVLLALLVLDERPVGRELQFRPRGLQVSEESAATTMTILIIICDRTSKCNYRASILTLRFRCEAATPWNWGSFVVLLFEKDQTCLQTVH
jgi:hypothetical protein